MKGSRFGIEEEAAAVAKGLCCCGERRLDAILILVMGSLSRIGYTKIKGKKRENRKAKE